MRFTHDIIVVGAGAGGLNIAGFMNKAGFRVLLIERDEASIGGDCLNYGCVPSKALIHASKAMSGVGIQEVMSYVRSKQEVFRKHESAEYFREQGMDVVLGKAKFVGPREVSVNGEVYSAKRIVLATGSRPRVIDIPGQQHVEVLNSENVWDLDKLPERVLVVGAGPIGLELGQAFMRLGSQVTFVSIDDKIVSKEDSEVADVLRRRLEKQGAKLLLSSKVEKLEGGKAYVTTHPSPAPIKIACDAVLLAIGREVNVENLGLDEAGIELDDGGLVVDEYLRTTNKHVLAVGDVVGQHQFTHAAELHAGLVLRNFFSPLKKKLNTDQMAWVTFTDPEIASFGLSEKDLEERGIPYQVLRDDFKDDDRAIIDDYPESLVKLFLDKKGKYILGGTMISPQAGELVQELILAMSAKVPVDKVFMKTYPYPTATRINRRTLHQHFAKKLTPKAKRILGWLYSWRR